MSDAVYARVTHDKGRVVILFSESTELKPKAIDRWEMDPPNCLEITEAMATACFEAREGMKPVGPALKAEIVERHRKTLTQRVSVIFNSMREKKTISNEHLAQIIVDTCLKEVF